MTYKSNPYVFYKVKNGKDGINGNNGSDGKGIKSHTITYQVGTSGTVEPKGTWLTYIPSVNPTQYLWTRITITYTDNTSVHAYSVGMMGATGDKGEKGDSGNAGVGVKSITNYYLASASSSGVTTSTSGWTTTVQTITATNKYLWNYEVVTFTDNSTSTTPPCIIGAYGNTGSQGATGSAGNGISSITEYYAVSTSNSTAPTTWVTTVPTLTETNKYMWNYEVIAFTNGTSKETAKRVIGVYGDKGATGSTGSTGTGIESITTEYYLSTSKTAQAGGSWQTTMPSWSYGKYLWIRSKVVYKNPSSTAYTTPYCDSSWEAVKNVEADILAWCYNNDKTYINGSKIYARSITSSQLSTDAIKSINYVANSTGSFLNLADGSFDSKYLKWTKEGVITATSGTIAGIKINTTSLTASTVSSGITRGYEITNDGDIRTYNKGSGRDYSLQLTADNVTLYSQTSAGSLPKQMSLTDSCLLYKSNETTTGYVDISNESLDLYGKSGVRVRSTLKVNDNAFFDASISMVRNLNGMFVKYIATGNYTSFKFNVGEHNHGLIFGDHYNTTSIFTFASSSSLKIGGSGNITLSGGAVVVTSTKNSYYIVLSNFPIVETYS